MNNEILEILQEECAEVIQAVSKVKRFGWDNSYGDGPTNREHLTEEIGDLLAMIELIAENEVDMQSVYKYALAKKDKLRKWSSIKV